MKLTKLIFNSGKHDYKEISEKLLLKVRIMMDKKQVLLDIDGIKFQPVDLTSKIPVLKEFDFIEIKVAKLFTKLLQNKRFASAEKLFKAADISIENVIKGIGVPKNNPRIEKIRELKNQGNLSSKDKSMIQVLWWEAKRDAFQDLAKEMNVETPSQHNIHSTMKQVTDELNKRVLEAIRDYKSYPETK